MPGTPEGVIQDWDLSLKKGGRPWALSHSRSQGHSYNFKSQQAVQGEGVETRI